MVEPRAITYPITLTTAELAYLLGIVQAETLIGGNDQALFPHDQAAREAQWARGRERLEADGWLVWDAAAGHHRLSEALMVIIAAIADPEVVLLSQWRSAGQQHHGVSHYLSLDLVVEMATQADVYEFFVLASMTTLLERLANAIELPDTKDAGITFELSRGEVEQAKQTPTPEWLEAHGLSPQAARLFARTLRQPGRSGTITVLRTHLGKAVTMRLVGILASTDSLGWLATPVDDLRVRYMLADSSDLEAQLSTLISELRSLPLELADTTQ